ncbi:MAG: FtsX-like permease family protein [Chromatiales bacterium]|jgi:putative ABC transport system permease protein
MTLFRVALRNLLRRRFRTASIALAAGLACGLLFAATATLQTVEGTLDSGARRLGADIMVVPAGHSADASRLLIAGEPSNFYMRDDVVRRIAELSDVEAAAPQIFVTSANLECCSNPRVLLVGFDPDRDFTVGPWVRYLHSRSQEDAASVIVGANTLYATEGTYMTFFGKLFKMVSSIQPTGMAFLDESIFMTIDDARDMVRVSAERSSQPLTLAADQISTVMVKARQGADIGSLAARIANVIPGVQVVAIPELTATVRRDLRANIWGIVAAGVASWLMTLLVVGVTLSLAIHERRREIGLLRAMGATRAHVVGLLLSEVLLVTTGGGLLGILAGGLVFGRYLATRDGTLGAIPFLAPSPVDVALFALLCLGAVAFSAALAAMAPALRSARTEPYEAIRGGA